MKLFVVNTISGLLPASDSDFQEKLKLKQGEVYEVSLRLARNYEFHKKYFKLINIAWEFMREDQHEFFKQNKDSFRKTIEVASGHFDLIYSNKLKEWVEVPKSIAFDKMGEDEFAELYERVKDTLYKTALRKISQEEFEDALARF